MKLHSLPKDPSRKKVQRIGRGGKRGTTSGRGQKGQKSRSGHRMRPAQRDVLLRIPKRRGFRNKPSTKQEVFELQLSRLIAKAKPLAEGKKSLSVDAVVLKQLGLIPLSFKGSVKVIGAADAVVALDLHGIKTSAAVASMLEKAGGSVQMDKKSV
ncbi:MAG: ribosomal protein large subunit ribosomal protein [Candidatus Parcubacteria bacterium]|jgi:large subunit ribosomal protein L15